VNPALQLPGNLVSMIPNSYYSTSFGRACVNAATDYVDDGKCSYAGARWFAGANETKANPTAPGNQSNALFGSIPVNLGNYNNAGELPGVAVIHEPRSYETIQTTYRQMEGMMATVARAADFNVHWGAAGVIDSVIDVTHNVPVSFSDSAGATWGILNTTAGAAGGSLDARPGVLTLADWGCVAPFRTSALVGATGGVIACASPTRYVLSNTATLGSVAEISASIATNAPLKAASATPGFSIYVAGHLFFMEMAALPASGTVWTLRSYTGAIEGGNGGDPGDEGPYQFTGVVRPFTAVGAELRVNYGVTNQLNEASADDMAQIHTVPDPYYVTNEFEQSTDNKIIKFVNLPKQAIIRIYSSSGVLVRVLEHNSTALGGAEDWNVRNRNNQVVASGVYFYHIEAGSARRVGRFTIVNFAQ
jgi:hypothetical protein